MKDSWQYLTPANAKRVVIAWRDISEISAWDDTNDVIGPVHLETIGWLLYDGPDTAEPGASVLVIAKTYDHNEKRWADFTVFPRAVVKGVIPHEVA